MLVDGDATAVVPSEDAAVLLNRDLYAIAEAGHSFVDGVVYDLVDEVMKTAFIGGADVHTGAAADSLKPFEDLDVSGGVLGFCGFRHTWRLGVLALIFYHSSAYLARA